MAAKIDNYEPEDLDMTWETKGDSAPAPVRHHAPRPRVAPSARLTVTHWRIIAAASAVVLLLSLGWCGGSAAGRRYIQASDLAVTEAEFRADAAESAAAFWESEATSVTAALEAAESDVASLTAELKFWQQYASEASSTIATLQQQKATPKPAPEAAPKLTQASWSGGVEDWRPLAQKYFGPLGGNRVEEALLCISIETGGTGNPYAVSPSGKYVGLFQMDAGWGTDAQRRDPEYVFACAANSVAKNGSWKQWPPMVARGY